MKQFTTANVDRSGTYTRIHCERADLVSTPPAWMARGLQESASGYGPRLNSGFSIMFNGRLRRIYTRCFSNSGVCYIRGGGNWDGNIIIDCV